MVTMVRTEFEDLAFKAVKLYYDGQLSDCKQLILYIESRFVKQKPRWFSRFRCDVFVAAELR